MILPNDIKVIFFETFNGDRSVLEFEQWLYANRQLEKRMHPDDYLELIGYGYKGDRAAYGLKELLRKHIRPGEFKLWKQLRQKHPNGYTPNSIKTPFDEQLQRIKDKLPIAKNADEGCDVFCADTHEYLLNVPATEEEVSAFEHKHAIQLPPCYRSFLLVVGNGGIGSRDSGAGPGYGLYPLGCDADKGDYISHDCVLKPDMTINEWESLTVFVHNEENISNEQYLREARTLFGGILPLGTQGCTYIHALVLNGPHKGRVVNLDYNYLCLPCFSSTINFLDYYEGWLDAVIDGTLRHPNAPEYGYS
ncbi:MULTISPECIES: SMI1/KNR4 family protein [Niastella]|uniref:SMI1/KNR4 family protein n=1 Tax=Niastella soli TaxID=2821487 RepID=A0ABS3YW29_9BACT|nr:SMI1/KNR4 family protein [Niastella soli]MBO9202117.1 SMI1/KNR4 family protein [Niastella soli]